MADLPKHTIDDRLRAYAHRRRREAGGPFSLPPDGRRLLQAEVERQSTVPSAPSCPRIPWYAWPRLRPAWSAVLALGALAGLALVLRTTWVPGRTVNLAKTTRNSRPAPAATEAPSVAAPVHPVRAASPAPAAARSSPASGPWPSVVAPISFGAPGNGGAVRSSSQRFVQASAPDGINPPIERTSTVSVLKDFRLETVGERFRVIDTDGSVYEGSPLPTIAAAPAPDPQAGGGRTDRARTTSVVGSSRHEPLSDSARSFSARTRMEVEKGAPAGEVVAGDAAFVFSIPFMVTGTNRTLNQQVVFEGRLVLSRDAPRSDSAVLTSVGATTNGLGSWLRNSMVRGHATVGQSAKVEVNAMPRVP